VGEGIGPWPPRKGEKITILVLGKRPFRKLIHPFQDQPQQKIMCIKRFITRFYLRLPLEGGDFPDVRPGGEETGRPFSPGFCPGRGKGGEACLPPSVISKKKGLRAGTMEGGGNGFSMVFKLNSGRGGS